MLAPVAIDPECGDQDQVVADVQAVDLDHQKIKLRQVRGHPLGHALGGQRHEPARGRRFRGAVPGNHRQVALRKPDGAPELARRYVDQHQVHGPATKPILGLRRRPGRQRSFPAVEAPHPRSMHRNLAAVEADLARSRAPAVADTASAAAVRRAGELLGVLAQHLFDGADPGGQTEALK